MSRTADVVSIKSHNSKFILKIDSKDYETAIKDLKNKFSQNSLIKSITTINQIDTQTLDVVDVQKVKAFLKKEFGIDYVEKESRVKHNVNLKNEMQEINTVTQNVLTDTDKIAEDLIENTDYRTKIIKNNLRSGALIDYDGNILVIGDVNAGAQLIATGNIIVLGNIRGFASAGAKGDKSVMVIANKISATQLRIAELIAIPPKDDGHKKAQGVQIASVNDNKIEIQQY